MDQIVKPACGRTPASAFPSNWHFDDAAEDSHSQKNEQGLIVATLHGDDICTARGITARSSTPVLQICRRLIAVGHDQATPLHAYRGDVLCLRIRSIGEAARLEVSRTGFKRRCEGGTAPLVRKSEGGSARHCGCPVARRRVRRIPH
jgi:hypothetical protein